jgi:hypothetical protein
MLRDRCGRLSKPGFQLQLFFYLASLKLKCILSGQRRRPVSTLVLERSADLQLALSLESAQGESHNRDLVQDFRKECEAFT